MHSASHSFVIAGRHAISSQVDVYAVQSVVTTCWSLASPLCICAVCRLLHRCLKLHDRLHRTVRHRDARLQQTNAVHSTLQAANVLPSIIIWTKAQLLTVNTALGN